MTRYKYNSCFKKELDDYIKQRVKDGFDYRDSAYMMLKFDSFLVEEEYDNKFLSKDIIDRWCIQRKTENKNTRNKRLSSVRQFCRYLISINREAYIAGYYPSESKKIPYVLSKDEITRVFELLDKTRKDAAKYYYHYNYIIPVIYRLYYCCGLRNNEACSLKFEHILHDAKALMIVDTKNHKDRMVYLSDDMYLFLIKYVTAIKEIKPSIWLFPSVVEKKHIDRTYISKYFYNTIVKLGIGNKEHHPTVHSLRHTFVVHKVDEWLKNGIDINTKMPYLSKQLGHVSIAETFYYYHIIETSLNAITEKDRNTTIYPEVEIYEL